MNTIDFPVLEKCPLFADISEVDVPTMLGCLSSTQHRYDKDETIFAPGVEVTRVGIVLSGSARIEQNDYWGNRTILAHIGVSDLFGEAFSCAQIKKLPLGIYAAQDSEILFIDYQKIIHTCSSACLFHTQLIKNMLSILANKNVNLTRKMETITQRSTRAKLLAYLSSQAQKENCNSFTIPFNRQELADYLAVDRSAMSQELSKMQKEGLLTYHKSSFKLT